MSPAARLSLPARRNASVSVALAPNQFRVQGWDPVLIISQIVAFQAIHYLILALLLPLLLSVFASPELLSYEGGSSSISLAMDWRAFTGRTVSGVPATSILPPGLARVEVAAHGYLPTAVASITKEDLAGGIVRIVEWDPTRGWAVAVAWIVTSMIDVLYLYHFVRRPTHIFDFSGTLLFNHTILTTYYSHSFPSSLFYWFVLTVSAIAQIVTAEQMCVKREMREGFQVSELTPHLGATEPLPNVGGGGGGRGGGGHGRTVSLGVPKDRFLSTMEMGNIGNGNKVHTGKGGDNYDRIPTQDRDE
ncbi:uncharacterized protein JCM15063_000356 [Sporobolomyces koalae]|uniref:uncharacterized protein n=1 Tax=Sporobolomyces koalae TaxID=500713 RepID=UPI0031801BA4